MKILPFILAGLSCAGCLFGCSKNETSSEITKNEAVSNDDALQSVLDYAAVTDTDEKMEKMLVSMYPNSKIDELKANNGWNSLIETYMKTFGSLDGDAPDVASVDFCGGLDEEQLEKAKNYFLECYDSSEIILEGLEYKVKFDDDTDLGVCAVEFEDQSWKILPFDGNALRQYEVSED